LVPVDVVVEFAGKKSGGAHRRQCRFHLGQRGHGAVGIGERLLRVGRLEVRSKAFDRYVCREIQNRVEGLYRVLVVPRPVTQRFHVEPFVKQKVDVARIQ
jgi:hypothetical protein